MRDKIPTKNPKETDSLRTVQRALDILNTFSLEENELTLTEIALRISLAKSTTTRLLGTLEKNGLVSKDADTMKYKLGHKLSYLGYVANRSFHVGSVALPAMKILRDQTKETVNLYLLDDDCRICIEQMEGLQSLRHLVQIGQKLPLWAGAGGKVLLAYQNELFQQKVGKSPEAANRWADLEQELKGIVAQGFASSQDEREVGSSAVAAPIFGVDGSVRYSLSISGPTQRFSEDLIKYLEGLVKHAALQVSENLGYSGSTKEELKNEG